MSDEFAEAVKPKRAKRQRPKSRPQRWAGAAGAILGTLTEIESLLDKLDNDVGDLRGVQEEYEGWKDNQSENLANSPAGQKLEEICNLEIEDLANNLREAVDTAKGVAEEAEAIDLPRGFGRD